MLNMALQKMLRETLIHLHTPYVKTDSKKDITMKMKKLIPLKFMWPWGY